MDSQNKRRRISEIPNNESKPLSAWERRKLYAKQMYEKNRTGLNLENKTSILSKVNSGKQLQNPPKANSKRKLLVNDENILKENQPEKKHKPIKDSLFPKKKSPPKQKLQSGSDGKENSESNKSKSPFPVRRTSPRQHSVEIVNEKDALSEHLSVSKLRRSASFTIDKRTDETNTLEGENLTQSNVLETQDIPLYKNGDRIKATTVVKDVDAIEMSFPKEDQDNTKPEACFKTVNSRQNSKTQSLKNTPSKSGRKVSLLVKKDKFLKPANFSGKKMTRREQWMTWKQQQNKNNKPTSLSNRRMTCGPAVLDSNRHLSVKQVASKVNQSRNRRTLSSTDVPKAERIGSTSKSSLFTAISSKPHEQRNSSKLSENQKKNRNSHILPIKDKCSTKPGRKSYSSNILSKLTVAANVERSVANRKTSIEACKKSIFKSGSNKKVNRSNTKRKSIFLDQLLDTKPEDIVSEQHDSSIVLNSGENEVREQTKYDSVVDEESTSEQHTEKNLIVETKESEIVEQSENNTVINHTPSASGKDLALSRKKSVCFDIPLLGFTPGKTLPKTPRRDFTLRERLQLWLDNKGHSISSFRHVKCFGYHLSNMKPKKNIRKSQDRIDNTPVSETVIPVFGESPVLRTRSSAEGSLDSLADNTFDVNELLSELKVLLTNGHPTRDITEWLDELVKYLPTAEENPQYWICRSLVAELQSGVNGAIAVYHAALDKKVQCSREENEHKSYTAEICKALDGLLRRYTENFNKNGGQPQTPHRQEKLSQQVHYDTPREPLLDKRNIFNSTVIKYDVSYNTPGSHKSSVKAVVTPVRRSSRLSHAPMLQNVKSDTLLESLTDLPQDIKDEVLFRENTALILD